MARTISLQRTIQSLSPWTQNWAEGSSGKSPLLMHTYPSVQARNFVKRRQASEQLATDIMQRHLPHSVAPIHRLARKAIQSSYGQSALPLVRQIIQPSTQPSVPDPLSSTFDMVAISQFPSSDLELQQFGMEAENNSDVTFVGKQNTILTESKPDVGLPNPLSASHHGLVPSTAQPVQSVANQIPGRLVGSSAEGTSKATIDNSTSSESTRTNHQPVRSLTALIDERIQRAQMGLDPIANEDEEESNITVSQSERNIQRSIADPIQKEASNKGSSTTTVEKSLFSMIEERISRAEQGLPPIPPKDEGEEAEDLASNLLAQAQPDRERPRHITDSTQKIAKTPIHQDADTAASMKKHSSGQPSLIALLEQRIQSASEETHRPKQQANLPPQVRRLMAYSSVEEIRSGEVPSIHTTQALPPMPRVMRQSDTDVELIANEEKGQEVIPLVEKLDIPKGGLPTTSPSLARSGQAGEHNDLIQPVEKLDIPKDRSPISEPSMAGSGHTEDIVGLDDESSASKLFLTGNEPTSLKDSQQQNFQRNLNASETAINVMRQYISYTSVPNESDSVQSGNVTTNLTESRAEKKSDSVQQEQTAMPDNNANTPITDSYDGTTQLDPQPDRQLPIDPENQEATLRHQTGAIIVDEKSASPASAAENNSIRLHESLDEIAESQISINKSDESIEPAEFSIEGQRNAQTAATETLSSKEPSNRQSESDLKPLDSGNNTPDNSVPNDDTLIIRNLEAISTPSQRVVLGTDDVQPESPIQRSVVTKRPKISTESSSALILAHPERRRQPRQHPGAQNIMMRQISTTKQSAELSHGSQEEMIETDRSKAAEGLQSIGDYQSSVLPRVAEIASAPLNNQDVHRHTIRRNENKNENNGNFADRQLPNVIAENTQNTVEQSVAREILPTLDLDLLARQIVPLIKKMIRIERERSPFR